MTDGMKIWHRIADRAHRNVADALMTVTPPLDDLPEGLHLAIYRRALPMEHMLVNAKNAIVDRSNELQ